MFGSRSVSQRLRLARPIPVYVLLALVLLLAAACGAEDASGGEATATSGSGSDSGSDAAAADALVIGNIDSSNPAEKIEEFQPLAEYLAANLEDAGVSEGTVRIAKDPEEMAELLTSGEVDIYIDAAMPSLEVCEAVGCDFALRQWKGGTAELAGVFVTTADSDIESLQDLTGKIIMLEQPHSTVGHILPLVTLAEQGIAFREVADAEAEVGDDEVGYFVSPGGQTSTNMLLNGDIAALAYGERAFKQFSPDVQAQLKIIEKTVGAPSQLVAFSPEVPTELRDEVTRLMIELTDTAEGQAILVSLRETEKFEALPDGLEAELDELYETVTRTLGE